MYEVLTCPRLARRDCRQWHSACHLHLSTYIARNAGSGSLGSITVHLQLVDQTRGSMKLSQACGKSSVTRVLHIQMAGIAGLIAFIKEKSNTCMAWNSEGRAFGTVGVKWRHELSRRCDIRTSVVTGEGDEMMMKCVNQKLNTLDDAKEIQYDGKTSVLPAV